MNTAIANLDAIPTPVEEGETAADERLTVDNTSGGVQLGTIVGAGLHRNTLFILLDVQTADVMVTFDGSAPTTTNGHSLPAGTSVRWKVATARAAKFIRLTSTSGVIHASQFTY